MYSFSNENMNYDLSPKDIFVCYNSADATDVIEAGKIVQLLESEFGWTCWFAERDSQGGFHNTELIMAMIENCSVFLLVSSANPICSPYMQAAISQAMALETKRVEYKTGESFAVLIRRLNEFISKKGISYRDADFADGVVGAISPSGIRMLVFLFVVLAGGIFTAFTIDALIMPYDMAEVAAQFEPKIIVEIGPHPASETDEFRVVPMELVFITARAQQGDIDAQYELGQVHARRQSYSQAAYWFRRAAEGGHVEAMLEIGVLYQEGRGVRRNQATATGWFHEAAENGHAEMQFHLGHYYRFNFPMEMDWEDAIERAAYWYRRAALQDHAGAQQTLGFLYATGQGVETNIEAAAYWLRRSAMLGNLDAQNQLGNFYAWGPGAITGAALTDTPNPMAAYWYRKAAMRDHMSAQINLAWMYENGYVDGEPNPEQSYYWNLRAARLGHALAQSNVGAMYSEGRGVDQCYDQAVYWFRRAVEQGCRRGMAHLGLMYELGTGVEQDHGQAIHLYRNALLASQGWPLPEWTEERLERLLEMYDME